MSRDEKPVSTYRTELFVAYVCVTVTMRWWVIDKYSVVVLIEVLADVLVEVLADVLVEVLVEVLADVIVDVLGSSCAGMTGVSVV